MPIVFVTGHTDARDLAEGLERGAHDYVRKPVDPVELVARIRHGAASARPARRARPSQRRARADGPHPTSSPASPTRRHADDVLRRRSPARGATTRDMSAVLVDIDRFKSDDVHVPRRRRRRPARGRGAADSPACARSDSPRAGAARSSCCSCRDSPDATIVCERLRASISDRRSTSTAGWSCTSPPPSPAGRRWTGEDDRRGPVRPAPTSAPTRAKAEGRTACSSRARAPAAGAKWPGRGAHDYVRKPSRDGAHGRLSPISAASLSWLRAEVRELSDCDRGGVARDPACSRA